MTESLLIKVSLVFSIIGIIILFFISDKIKPKEYQINKLTKDELEKEVKIIGKIKNLKQLNKGLLITLEDKTSSIKVILFENKNIKLRTGINIEVIGKLKTYQKEFEIEAHEINIL